jgi:multicomponent Na+:H+ antiporter subunit E
MFVAYSLVTSSLRVALAVLVPTRKRTHPSVQRVRLARGSKFYGAIVANAITLTPGTMTLELDPATLELSVHVLGEVDPTTFTADVLDLERRVAAAFKERVRA